MAITTYHKLVCDCGHEGKIRLRENVTPYSNADWYSYMLIDFNGWPYRSECFDSWKLVLSIMKPACPKCNRIMTTKNLIE